MTAPLSMGGTSTQPAPLGKRWRQRLPLVALALALVGHSAWFDFVCDDAYISFVYARNLANHGQLVFNLGERVEGYTNFLWTLLLAGFLRIGLRPETMSVVLGLAFGCATLLVVARSSARLRGRPSAWDLVAPGLLAASSGYACWCHGGLETQMFAFLTALTILLAVEEKLLWAGLVCGLAALTRPEGMLIFALVLLCRVVAHLAAVRRLALRRSDIAFAAAFGLIFLPYFAWRWSYYGWPLPNTFYVKTAKAPSPEFAQALHRQGMIYLRDWAIQNNAVFAFPLVILAVLRHRFYGTLLLLLSVAYFGYMVAIGGDFMGLHRLMMPVFVAMASLAGLGVEETWRRMPGRSRPLTVAALLLAGGAHVATQVEVSTAAMEPKFEHGLDRPGYLARYTHDRTLIAQALAPYIKRDDVVVIGGAGVIPWHIPMRGIDVFGLTSVEIAHTVTPTNPRPGHELWASDALVLKYRPEFLLQCYAISRAPRPVERLPWRAPPWNFLAHGYVAETLFVPGVEDGAYFTFLRRSDRPFSPRTD